MYYCQIIPVDAGAYRPPQGQLCGSEGTVSDRNKETGLPSAKKRHITLQMKLLDLATMLAASLGAGTAELSLPWERARDTNDLERTGKLLL